MDEHGASVAEVARRSMSTFTPAERRVARALLAAYPVAGLETVAELARRSNVSGPTVIRFSSKLGFDSFMQFQQVLKAELLAKESSPANQLASHPEPHDTTLQRMQASMMSAIEAAFTNLPPDEYFGAGTLLAQSAKNVHVLGGRFSNGLAEYLCGHLEQVRPRVTLIQPGGPNDLLLQAMDMTSRDVLVAFDFRRYQAQTIDFARAAHSRGATIVLFTDPWLSPIAEIARYVLPAPVKTSAPFDSLTPSFALVDSIMAVIVEDLADAAQQRVTALEEFVEHHTARTIVRPSPKPH